MPGRHPPLIDGQVYHIFNRGIAHQDTFMSPKDYQRACTTIDYYRTYPQSICLSRFLSISDEAKQESQLFRARQSAEQVDIYSYCLMPNHFHLLLRQNIDQGISRFLGNLQNSYTRYFNTRHNRDGSLFLDQFKAVLITTDEELIHVSRYIHLNPYTSFLVKTVEEVALYPWSSLSAYLNNSISFVKTDVINNFFSDKNSYEKFIYDQADYQRQLGNIHKHISLE